MHTFLTVRHFCNCTKIVIGNFHWNKSTIVEEVAFSQTLIKIDSKLTLNITRLKLFNMNVVVGCSLVAKCQSVSL